MKINNLHEIPNILSYGMSVVNFKSSTKQPSSETWHFSPTGW